MISNRRTIVDCKMIDGVLFVKTVHIERRTELYFYWSKSKNIWREASGRSFEEIEENLMREV